jgi:hypothetical protein
MNKFAFLIFGTVYSSTQLDVCLGYWEIPQFSIRGLLGNQIVECTNMNEKGCMRYVAIPGLDYSIKSECKKSFSSEIPHLRYFDYFCDYEALLKKFKLEMINDFNLTCFNYYV